MALKGKPTRVDINDKYFVEIDNYNHTLYVNQEVTNRKTKTKAIKPVIIGYYPNMKLCLKAIKRHELSDITSRLTLNEYLATLNDIERKFANYYD